jgi:adenylate cyclase
MPSQVPGYEYDIFISYRHNDNRSGWVTEFVAALQEELATTVKEPLSVYFDKNAQDGLLETHDVEKSLERKLKCLIFIPIISQTYCDRNSFAWRHEFVAFNKESKQDEFGRDIKLSSGNVASRILPVRIHELDQNDRSTIEKEIGGMLRGVEFIYKESGVNRPLRSAEDHPAKNQLQTTFRNQVNKVANGVKEIITALKNPPDGNILKETRQPRAHRSLKKPALASLLILILAAAAFFVYRQPSMILAAADPDKSIAVLPFVNTSSDPEQEYFSDGISEEILNLLAKVPELKVIGRTSSFYFKGKNEDLRVIGEKLGASYVLEGSLRKDRNMVRITAQLIKASDGTHLWSETFERKLENIFQLQDEIASNVLRQMKLTLLKAPSQQGAAINQDAYNLILKGRYFVDRGDYKKGLEFYEQARSLDSTQAIVWTSLAQATVVIGNADFKQFEKNLKLVRHYAEKALSIDESFSEGHRVMHMTYLAYDFDFNKARQELNTALQLDPNNSDAYRNLGILEGAVGNLDEALAAASKSVELNPLSVINVSNLARAYANKQNFKKAEQILTESLELSPSLESQLLNLYISNGKTEQAEKLFNKRFDTWDPSDREIIQAEIMYLSGKKPQAIKYLNESLKHYDGNSYRVARAFAFMDQREPAFQWLAKAYDEKFGIFSIKTNSSFKKFHDDPRYIAMLKKMNLPI